MLDWIAGHQALLWWLGLGSLITFVASLIAVPWLVTRIPADYFTRSKAGESGRRAGWRHFLMLIRNLLGVLLVSAGIVMLVLPGQGILTILVGLMVMEFPGKTALELWLVRQPAVIKSINWIRDKAGKPELRVPVQ